MTKFTQLEQIDEGDVIVACSFGRNSLRDKELYVISRIYNQTQNQDFVATAALLKLGFDPGLPNREIAELCQRLSSQTARPMILQWEVAAALDLYWYQQNQKRIIAVWPPENGSHLSTRGFALTAQDIMNIAGLRKPILVTHNYHQLRASLIFKKLGLNPIIIDTKINSFDANSVQPFTRSLKNWMAREIPSRIYHWFAEWI
ncbi:MAG: YdcF family protein [Candidatus Doudnabacteria bacterium]|nr:YdcF family protein [Candidatus Doudnabacteria bacterium]